MEFTRLIESLAEKLGVEIADEGGAAGVEVDGLTVLMHQADDELILFHADIGEIPAEGRDALSWSAMRANFLYRGTGGSTLAVNPLNGHLHVQKYNWLERLDPDKAFDTLSRFADTALTWQKMLTDYRSLNSGDETAASGVPDGFMQV